MNKQKKKKRKMYRHKIQNALGDNNSCVFTDTSSILKYKNCQLLTWNKISNKSYIEKSLIQSVIDKR